MKGKKFSIVDNGIEYRYEIIKIFNVSNRKDTYIYYMDTNGERYISRCDIKDKDIEVYNIEDDREWEEVCRVVEDIDED